MIIVGWTTFILYIYNRIHNSVCYNKIRKKCREKEIEIEKNFRPPIMRNNQLVRPDSYSNEEF